MAHLTNAQQIAAGLHAIEPVCQPFAATQAAWRFYHNLAVTLPQLVQPLQEATRQAVAKAAGPWALVVHDWSKLHYGTHSSKTDRVPLTQEEDLGYELLSALVLESRHGHPLGVVSQDVRAADGLHSTRHAQPGKASSALDGLSEVLEYVEGLKFGASLVHIADREADSVTHYRQWSDRSYHWLVRADDSRRVRYGEQDLALSDLPSHLKDWQKVRVVEYHGRPVDQWVAQAAVVLERLSGRQINRCRNPEGFTMPALLAGLGVLLPMLLLLEQYPADQLRQMVQAVLPGLPLDTS